jgi:hypothetical protein
VTTGKSRTEALDEFKRSVLEKARALCLAKVPKLAELLGDLGHVDRSKCPTPLEALKTAYQLRQDYCGIQVRPNELIEKIRTSDHWMRSHSLPTCCPLVSWDVQAPGNETEEGRLLSTLEALGEASGKGWRWEHLKALGLRCTPRNIFYLAKGTDNGKQVSGQLT